MSTTRRIENWIITVGTLFAAAIWFFPLYWSIVTSLRTDESVVANPGLVPDQFVLSAYFSALFNTKLLTWYFNSIPASPSGTPRSEWRVRDIGSRIWEAGTGPGCPGAGSRIVSLRLSV